MDPQLQQLLDYISLHRQQGFDDPTIRAALAQAGWKPEQIEQAFAGAQAVQPQPTISHAPSEHAHEAAADSPGPVKTNSLLTGLLIAAGLGIVNGYGTYRLLPHSIAQALLASINPVIYSLRDLLALLATIIIAGIIFKLQHLPDYWRATFAVPLLGAGLTQLISHKSGSLVVLVGVSIGSFVLAQVVWLQTARSKNLPLIYLAVTVILGIFAFHLGHSYHISY